MATTFGFTGNGVSEDNTDNTKIAYLWQYTGVTGGTIASGVWRGRRVPSSGNTTVWLGLYSDNGTGVPINRLDMISATLALTTTVTTFTINGTGSTQLVNGQSYWIAASSDFGVGWRCEFDSDAAIDTSWQSPFVGALPASWGTESGALTWKMAFYFNITEPSGFTAQQAAAFFELFD